MTGDHYPLAPLGRRGVAWLIDACLGGALAIGFVKVAGGEQDVKSVWDLMIFKSVKGKAGHQLSAAMSPTGANLGALRSILGLLALITVIAVVAIAYRVVTTAQWGAGIGKALLGLRIVTINAESGVAQPPGWARSWRRWLVPQAPGMIPLPGTSLLAYLPALKDSQRRGLHDRAAGTIVVDVRTPPPPPPAAEPWRIAALDGYRDDIRAHEVQA